jgi:hypothetical protein
VDVEPEPQEILLELGLLIIEGRRANTTSPKGFEEGPHCLRQLQKAPRTHSCTHENQLVLKYVYMKAIYLYLGFTHYGFRCFAVRSRRKFSETRGRSVEEQCTPLR